MKRLVAPYQLVSLLIVAVYLFAPHGSRGSGSAGKSSPGRDWVVAPPHIYVLAVGIDHYPSKLFMDLAGSVNDAELLAAVFKSPQFSPQAEVQILTEQRATKNAIRSAIQRWAGVVHPEDLFVLSFSGQQATNTRKDLSGEVYMAPYDFARKPNCNNPDFSCADQESLISGALLYSWMTQIRSRRQVLLLDTGLTERAIPVFERYWRKEACNVGPEAAKRILLLTNHGFGMEFQMGGKAQGQLSLMVSNALATHESGTSETRIGSLLVTAVKVQQSVYRQFLASGFHGGREQVRAEILGGDFVISGPPGREALPEELLLDSGLGPVCSEDDESRGIARTASVNAPPGTDQKNLHRNYALVVATDNYENWPHLSNPILDATAIEAALRDIYGFEVEHLFDPSRKELKSKLDQLHSLEFGPDDQVFIFIAGHGDYDALNDIGYLVFKNSPPGHDHDTDLDVMQLRNRIDTLPASHILLVMDSCFAGTLDPDIGGSGSRSNYDPIPLDQLVKRSANKRTRIFLTSGDKEYVPDGRPGHHSPFAALFINALESKGGRDEYLSLAQLPSYFQRLTTSARMGSFGHNDSGSQFFFIPQGKAH